MEIDKALHDETVRVIDFKGDPQTLFEKHITPKALEALYEQLDTDNPVMRDKAIQRVMDSDKRLRKDAPQVGVNITFPPEYLRTVGEGIKGIFGGRKDAIEVERVPMDERGVSSRGGTGLPGERVEKD